MKTLKRIALVALLLAPAALFAADASSVVEIPAKVIDIATKVAIWYGIVCAGLNGLTILVSGIVKQTPGTSDDEAVDKFYNSKVYKAVAWVFSWGDYIGELVSKLRK
jgi:hypothetical protein